MKKHNNQYRGGGKEVWKELEAVISSGHDRHTVFNDFLDFVLNALLSLTDNLKRHSYEEFMERATTNTFDGVYEEMYMEVVGRYKNDRVVGEREIDHFAKAWALLQAETIEKQEDIIGLIYEQCITFGERGQFFTPAHLADMIAKMICPEKGETVTDPSGCGSGKMLIAASKISPNAYFEGRDIDSRCVRMAVINMHLLDLNAKIIQGNALLMEEDVIYEVRRGGYVYEIIPEKRPKVEQEEIKAQSLELQQALF